MDVLAILRQYAAGASPPPADVSNHFDSVASQVPQQSMGGAIAAAMRSDATPSFSDTVASLFGRSSPEQRAGVLNELLQSVAPGALATVGGGFLSKLFGPTSPGTITPAQAAQVSPAQVGALAQHAESQDGEIVQRIGNFYAQHPTLVKSLGVAALSVVMSHLGKQTPR